VTVAIELFGDALDALGGGAKSALPNKRASGMPPVMSAVCHMQKSPSFDHLVSGDLHAERPAARPIASAAFTFRKCEIICRNPD